LSLKKEFSSLPEDEINIVSASGLKTYDLNQDKGGKNR